MSALVGNWLDCPVLGGLNIDLKSSETLNHQPCSFESAGFEDHLAQRPRSQLIKLNDDRDSLMKNEVR